MGHVCQRVSKYLFCIKGLSVYSGRHQVGGTIGEVRVRLGQRDQYIVWGQFDVLSVTGNVWRDETRKPLGQEVGILRTVL